MLQVVLALFHVRLLHIHAPILSREALACSSVPTIASMHGDVSFGCPSFFGLDLVLVSKILSHDIVLQQFYVAGVCWCMTAYA